MPARVNAVAGVAAMLALAAIPAVAAAVAGWTVAAMGLLLGAMFVGLAAARETPRGVTAAAVACGVAGLGSALAGGHAITAALWTGAVAAVTATLARQGRYQAFFGVPTVAVVFVGDDTLGQAALVGGGLLLGGVYGAFVVHRLGLPSPAPVPPLGRRGTGLFATALALMVAAATYVTVDRGLPHGYWLALTIIAVLIPGLDTRRRSVERIGGTILGAAGAVAVAAVVDAPVLLVLLAVFLMCLGIVESGSRYSLGTAYMTAAVILLVGIDGGTEQVAELRFGLTLAGGAIILLLVLLTGRGMKDAHALDEAEGTAPRRGSPAT